VTRWSCPSSRRHRQERSGSATVRLRRTVAMPDDRSLEHQLGACRCATGLLSSGGRGRLRQVNMTVRTGLPPPPKGGKHIAGGAAERLDVLEDKSTRRCPFRSRLLTLQRVAPDLFHVRGDALAGRRGRDRGTGSNAPRAEVQRDSLYSMPACRIAEPYSMSRTGCTVTYTGCEDRAILCKRAQVVGFADGEASLGVDPSHELVDGGARGPSAEYLKRALCRRQIPCADAPSRIVHWSTYFMSASLTGEPRHRLRGSPAR
jgi:hypothetical protein